MSINIDMFFINKYSNPYININFSMNMHIDSVNTDIVIFTNTDFDFSINTDIGTSLNTDIDFSTKSVSMR